jgi:RNA polymerase sigma factor (sigma-70 family)
MYPRLSAQDEIDLTLKVQTLWAQESRTKRQEWEIKQALDKIIKSNYGAIYSLSKRYPAFPIQDLAQETILYIFKGLLLYDPSKGARVSTYLFYWIHLAIRRYVKKQMKNISRSISLDASVLEGKTLLDSLAASEVASPVDAIEQRTGLTLDELLSDLTEQERLILELRYLEDLTLQSIADETDMKIERVRQLQHRAIRKVRARLSAGVKTEPALGFPW